MKPRLQQQDAAPASPPTTPSPSPSPSPSLAPDPAPSRKDPVGGAPAGFQRLKLVVAYDGARYLGWQVQTQSPTVQECLEAALARIFPSHPRVVGSSRTDTGVHARGMVVHFDVPAAEFRMVPRKVLLALNAHLPDDIRVMSATRAARDFHARFDAARKQYRYLLWNHAALDPAWRRQAWHVTRPLDIASMKLAAGQMIGRHNFRSFASNPGYERSSYVREILRCQVIGRGPLITVVIEADGFLYKMCRGIVGTLVQVGLGKFSPGEIVPMLEKCDRRIAGMTAPAHGLTLWQVFYRKPSKTTSAERQADEAQLE